MQNLGEDLSIYFIDLNLGLRRSTFKTGCCVTRENPEVSNSREPAERENLSVSANDIVQKKPVSLTI